MVFRGRDLLVGQRTQIINALRGHMAEHGWVAPKGPSHVGRLAELLEDEAAVPQAARPVLRMMIEMVEELERRIADLDREIARRAREDETARRLMTIAAITFKSGVDNPTRFRHSRDVGPHFGLTPRKYQSGELDVTGRISKVGDRMVRTALYEAALRRS
jgi:transposase